MSDEIKVWIQLFFEDGSVSQGKRIPAYYLDEGYEKILWKVENDMLKDLNRDSGLRVMWGAGNLKYGFISYEAQDLDSSVSDS